MDRTHDLPRTVLRTQAQRLGDAAEVSVAAHLAAGGWTLLGRNVRFGRNEVDLLAVDPGPPAALVVVEVRWRGSRAFGVGEETFDWRKRSHLRAAVGRILDSRALPDGTPLPRLPVRIDLVIVEPAEGSPPSGSLAASLVAPSAVPRMRHHRDALVG